MIAKYYLQNKGNVYNGDSLILHDDKQQMNMYKRENLLFKGIIISSILFKLVAITFCIKSVIDTWSIDDYKLLNVTQMLINLSFDLLTIVAMALCYNFVLKVRIKKIEQVAKFIQYTLFGSIITGIIFGLMTFEDQQYMSQNFLF